MSAPSDQRRWGYVGLVTLAIAISYFDRQTLPVAIAAIQRSIPISSQQFSWLQAAFLISYALLYAGGGKLLDTLGTRNGFVLIMAWWSAACALHGRAHSYSSLLGARLLLGMGEGGGFPAATRVVAEWMPVKERSTAMGIINAGTAIGSVAAPPLIGLILGWADWRRVFFLAGGVGLLWTAWWFASYPPPSTSQGPDLTANRGEESTPWLSLLRSRQVIGLVATKFLSDAAWYFYLFWLPKYLYDARGFDVKHVSYFAWIPYAAAGIGSFSGGWLSSHLLFRGYSLDFARKLALGLSACLMPSVILVTHASIPFAIALFSIAFFGQQSWSGLIMTLPADMFSIRSVGSVAGLIGFGGAIGGGIFNLIAGRLLTLGFGYSTLFAMAGTFHLIAFGVILAVVGKIHAPQNRPEVFEGAAAV